jgi:hypothetical protein
MRLYILDTVTKIDQPLLPNGDPLTELHPEVTLQVSKKHRYGKTSLLATSLCSDEAQSAFGREFYACLR